MSDRRAIVVYGATGFTGGLTVDALVSRGVRPIVAGRNDARVREIAARHGLDDAHVIVADSSQPHEIARMVERAAVVVSCAGPFVQFGEPVVAACASRGVHYVDSTGEAAFVQMVSRRYEATARARKCVLAPAMAFEVSVADAAAERAANGLEGTLDVEIAYASSKGTTSRGTRASIAEMLLRPGLRFEHGELREEPLGAIVRDVVFASPFGTRHAVSFASPELLTIPRHVNADSVRTLMSMRNAGAVRKLAAVLRFSAPVAGGLLRRALSRGEPSPSPEQRARARFQVAARVKETTSGRGRTVIVSGNDPYGLSAVFLAEAAIRLSQTDPPGRGLLAPSQVLGAGRILGLIQPFDGSVHDERFGT